MQDNFQAETAEDDFHVYAAARRPGYAQQCGPSALGVQADHGRAVAHAHLHHHCTALHGRRADLPRAISVHGGQLRPEITTFHWLLPSR